MSPRLMEGKDLNEPYDQRNEQLFDYVHKSVPHNGNCKGKMAVRWAPRLQGYRAPSQAIER